MCRWHYVYYSYEEWGRGYIGKRTSKVPPDQDSYLGSWSDDTFRPTQKIVIAEFASAEEALEAEIALHHFYCVDTNSHFANKAKQTSSKFYYVHTTNPHSRLSEQEKAVKALKVGMAHCAGARGFYYRLVSLSGEIIITKNLRETCRAYRLNRGNLRKVLKGQRTHSKGWAITKHSIL